MIKLQHISILFLFALSTLIGCISDSASTRKGPINAAMGRVNEVFVLADADLVNGQVGDTLRYYFQSPYIILPQPEPIYDLQFETMQSLEANKYRKEMAVFMVIANLEDEGSPTTQLVMEDISEARRTEIKADKGYAVTIGRNKWAGGQILIYVIGFGEDKLVENLRRNFPGIAQKLNKEYIDTFEANAYQGGTNASVIAELTNDMGVYLKVPGDFKKAIYDEETQTMWLRRDGKEEIVNLLIRTEKYDDQSQLTKEGLKAIRNEIGKQYITTSIDSSYMHIDDVNLPLFVESTQLNGNFALEARGIWEMVNDYMAGPFMSYLLHDAESGTLLFVDGFVYAPGEPKRDIMQELEVILRSAAFKVP